MRTTLFALAGALLAAGVTPGASAGAITVSVDCNRGQAISTALLQGDQRSLLTIKVRGTCSESVLIARDKVTLQGDPSATIHGSDPAKDVITIEANDVTLQGLTVTGGYYGVRQDHGLRFMIQSCVIQDTANDGIRVFVGDTRFLDSTVQRAGSAGVFVARGGSFQASRSQFINNASSGIIANGNATVNVGQGSTISENGVHGVQLDNASQGTINGSKVNSNRGTGISAATSMIAANNNEIVNNADAGVLVLAGSVAWVSNNRVSGSTTGLLGNIGGVIVSNGDAFSYNGTGVACNANCTLSIGGATINYNYSGGIVASLASKIIFGEPTTDGGSNNGPGLSCLDGSSHAANLELFNGTIENCTGF